jgi:hypothetical protein
LAEEDEPKLDIIEGERVEARNNQFSEELRNKYSHW